MGKQGGPGSSKTRDVTLSCSHCQSCVLFIPEMIDLKIHEKSGGTTLVSLFDDSEGLRGLQPRISTVS